jgi:hypothetical protein
MTNNALATDLILGLLASGGATLDTTTGIAPRDGYMVGVAGHGIAPPIPVDGRHSVALVSNWIEREADLLARDNAYVGAWRDEDGGRDYFDVSLRYGSLDEALAVARQTGEIAVWSLHESREIRA